MPAHRNWHNEQKLFVLVTRQQRSSTDWLSFSLYAKSDTTQLLLTVNVTILTDFKVK